MGRSARWWLPVLVASLLVSVLMARELLGESRVESGDYSGVSREEMRIQWPGAERFPLLVPERMPDGAEEHPEVGFELSNVGVDPAQRPAKRVWVSLYSSDVLAEHGSFRIYQRPERRSEPCAPMGDVPVVQRKVGRAHLAICSLDLTDGSAARDYWEQVTFTSDYDAVPWLPEELED